MSQPLIIAQIVQHLAPGGIETMAIDLQQAPKGSIVHIISLQGTYTTASQHWKRLQKLENLHFLNKRETASPLTVFRLALLLKRLNVSTIHTHHTGPLLYGGLAAKLAGCHHVHTEHDTWHLHNKKRRVLVQCCYRLFKPTLVAVSNTAANTLHQLFSFTSPTVVYNGIDTIPFRTLGTSICAAANTITGQCLHYWLRSTFNRGEIPQSVISCFSEASITYPSCTGR